MLCPLTFRRVPGSAHVTPHVNEGSGSLCTEGPTFPHRLVLSSSWLPLQPYKSPLTFRQGKKSQKFALLASLDAFISRVSFYCGINLCNFCLMRQQDESPLMVKLPLLCAWPGAVSGPSPA